MSNRDPYEPGAAAGAEVHKDGNKWTLVLVRDLRHPPSKVWEALTEPVQLREWAPFDADRNLGTVGPVKLSAVGAPTPHVSATTVKRAEAPKVLEGEEPSVRFRRGRAASRRALRGRNHRSPGANTMAGKSTKKPTLLAGGNPQIAKADGDAPVQASISAMPGWKRDVGRRLDALIVRTVPEVRKAVNWNSPFYGIEGQGWFLDFHCFTKYVKVAFPRGTSRRPLSLGESKHEETRYLDIHEDDVLDEARFAGWVKQASRLPGWGKD
jgi:hypothetical protein